METPETLKPFIEEDLESLWKHGKVRRAEKLNEELTLLFDQKGQRPLSEDVEPLYFTGDPKANTVLVMLNPGGGGPKQGAEKQMSFDSYLTGYLEECKSFGDHKKERGKDDPAGPMLNSKFDLKQAAFLGPFDKGDLKIPEKFWKQEDEKETAERNVMNNKLQLELLPYSSDRFKGLFNTQRDTKRHLNVIEPYVERVFQVICEHPRDHVLFCSRQFDTLFKVLSQESGKWDFKPGKEKSCCPKDQSLKFKKVRVGMDERSVEACIASSFPMQSLHNAYELMEEYGRHCKAQMDEN